MEKGCEHDFCPAVRGCYLVNQIKAQAESGGYQYSHSRGDVGPYWAKGIWHGFCQGAMGAARRFGCANIQEVEKTIGRVTAQKQHNGELF